MANVLKHRFSSGKVDGADATQIQPSHWNDGHNFSGGNAGDLLTRDPTDATYGAKWAPPAPQALPAPGGNTGDLLVRDTTVATYGAKWAPPGVWQPYTPAWKALSTNCALNNGTITGRYMTLGKTCFFHIDLQMGSTTAFGAGTYTLTLPLPALTTLNFGFSIWATLGNGWNYTLGSQLYLATEFYMPLTNGLQGVWTPTSPIAITASDHVHVTGVYELATAASLLRDLLESADIARPSDAEIGPVIIG